MQCYNLNKLGGSLLGLATYQILKTLGIVVSNKKIFILKIYFSPCDLDMQWAKLFEHLFKRVIQESFLQSLVKKQPVI